MKRRDFLKTSLSTLALPLLSTLESCQSDGSLGFPGRVVGEDSRIGHLFRDGKLKIPQGLIEASYDRPVDSSCIIIGGGCSGVAVGWRLHRSGIKDFILLEKENQLGGNAQSRKGNQTEYSWGAHYIETPGPEARYLYPLYEDLGIILGYQEDGWPVINDAFTVRDTEVMLHTDKGWTPHRYPLSLANKEEQDVFQRFRQKMYQWYHYKGKDGKTAFTLPIQACSQDPSIRKLDRITMKTYLRSEGLKSSYLDWYVDMQCRDNYGTGFHEISAWVAVNYFATNFSDFDVKESDKHPVDIITWPEGNQYLVKGMSRQFSKENIRMNAFVVDVKNHDNHVLVTYYETREKKFYTLKGKTAVFALPKFLLTRVCRESKDREKLLSHFEYAPWLVANVHVKRPPGGKELSWDTIQYQPMSTKSNGSLGYILSNYQDRRLRNKLSEPSVLTFYAPLLQSGVKKERLNLLNNGWDYWANRVVKDLSIMHPNITDLIERLDIYKWGHAMIRPTVGFVWGKEREKMKEPIGRIFMAHCDVGGLPIFEQAAYSGFESAESILGLLGKSYDKLIG